MFPNNLHHKNQIYLFGSEVQKGNADKNEDQQPIQSEYRRTYEESLKKAKEESDRQRSQSRENVNEQYQGGAEAAGAAGSFHSNSNYQQQQQLQNNYDYDISRQQKQIQPLQPNLSTQSLQKQMYSPNNQNQQSHPIFQGVGGEILCSRCRHALTNQDMAINNIQQQNVNQQYALKPQAEMLQGGGYQQQIESQQNGIYINEQSYPDGLQPNTFQDQIYQEQNLNMVKTPPNAQGQSIEQIRYYDKVNRAQSKQNQLYQMYSSQQHLSEKEKLAQQFQEGRDDQQIFLQQQQHLNLAQSNGKRRPLGKIVTQLEMNDPEIRKQLKTFLDQQIKEKNARKFQEQLVQKKAQREIQEINSQYTQEQRAIQMMKKGQQQEYRNYLEQQKVHDGNEAMNTAMMVGQQLADQQRQQASVENGITVPFRYDQQNDFNIISNSPFSQKQFSNTLPPRAPMNTRSLIPRAQTHQEQYRSDLQLPQLQQQYTNLPQSLLNPSGQIPYSRQAPQLGLNNSFTQPVQMSQYVDPMMNPQLNQQMKERRNSQQYFSQIATKNIL